jgi:molecular chaperone HscB
MDACWQCGNAAIESLFCKLCNALQQPTPDYYRFFGLPRRLAIDSAELQKRFYDLSRILHPDRFLRRAPTEQQYSLEATAILNDGYRVLRDPVSRAEYVLRDFGCDIGEQRSKNVPPELLEEVFELNMALEELRGGDQSARPHLEDARKKFIGMRDEADAQLSSLFQRFDATQDRAVLEEIRGVLNRRRYIRNLVTEVEKELGF